MVRGTSESHRFGNELPQSNTETPTKIPLGRIQIKSQTTLHVTEFRKSDGEDNTTDQVGNVKLSKP